MKNILLFFSFLQFSFTCFAAPVAAPVAASSFKIKIKRVAVSTIGDCSNPTIVYDSGKDLAGIEYVDLAANPNLFSQATVANGTYNCVIWEVSDVVKFTPAGNDGASCTIAGGELTRDICGYGFDLHSADAATINPNKLIDGVANYACTTTAEEVKPLYFSTWSTATTGDGVQTGVPPTQQNDATKGLKLASPIVVSGATQGILEFDTTGAITTWDYKSSGNLDCSPQYISFSLR